MNVPSVPRRCPLLLDSPRVWRTYVGGGNLETLHGRSYENSQFPEEWIASVVEARNPGREHISEGLSKLPEYGDLSLRDLIRSEPAAWLGEGHIRRHGATPGVLVKLIDSAERLTLQVHPDRETARRLFDSPFGKTECWYILGGQGSDGSPPCIYLGFKPGITREIWEGLFQAQDIPGMLSRMHRIPVEPGQTILIQGGVPHAIGEGCLLTEIQEPTDYTIRVERTTPKGLAVSDALCHQGLGFQKMFDCFHFQGLTEEEVRANWIIPPQILQHTCQGVHTLHIGYSHTPLFRLESAAITGTMELPPAPEFSGLYVLEGSGVLAAGESRRQIRQGQQYFLPPQTGALTLTAQAGGRLRILRFQGPRV